MTHYTSSVVANFLVGIPGAVYSDAAVAAIAGLPEAFLVEPASSIVDTTRNAS